MKQLKNFLIKREQSQTRLSFAECEKSRLIAKLSLTLLLLITAAAGAWAQTETLLTTITATDKDSYSETTPGVVTVTHDNGGFWYEYGWTWSNAGSLTVEAKDGYIITKCVFRQATRTPVTVSTAPFKVKFVETHPYEEIPAEVKYLCEGVDPMVQMDGVSSIEVYGYADPTIEVTTNAASAQDLFTTASFTMPASDVTVNYTLVRDMQYQANPVTFSGIPTSDITVKKGDDGKYQPAEALTIQLTDPLITDADAQNIIAADGITVTVEKKGDGDTWTSGTFADFLADMQPGTYRLTATPKDETSPYDGTVTSGEFTLVEKYDLVVKPANDFSKNGLDKVTVGTEEITPDATTGKVTKNGIDPDTEVKLKAKRGYVIEKVEAKKTVIPMLNAATTENIGMVVCNKGHLHDAKEAVPDGCTAVGILGKVTGTGHGLILALKNATNQNWNTINGWTSASYAGTTLKVLPDDAARGTNLTSYTTLGETTVSNWAVAQKSDYVTIFTNLGSTAGNNHGNTYNGNVNAYITTGVGGTALSGRYWSATKYDILNAWYFDRFWDGEDGSNSRNVRPVLGF